MSIEQSINHLADAINNLASAINASPEARIGTPTKPKKTQEVAASTSSPTPSPTPSPAPASTPDDASSVTIDAVRQALSCVVNEVSMDAAKEVISSFDVARIPDLNPDRYAAFVAACKDAIETNNMINA